METEIALNEKLNYRTLISEGPIFQITMMEEE